MKNQISVIILSTILFLSFLQAQDDNSNCPPLFTHERTINPEISIINIEVIDSNKYDSLPKFKGNIKTISKKIVYPEIAKRAGVEGTVKLLVSIDTIGNVLQIKVNKGLGAGIEEFAMDVLFKEKFFPAILNNKNVSSQLEIDINFDLNLNVDLPNMEIDEIKYELIGSQIYHEVKIIFNKKGDAYFSEDWGTEPAKKWQGEIDHNIYTHLSDFIISQCFLEYKNYYYGSSTDHERRETVTVKTDTIEKYVRSNGKGDPVGLWAIINLIPYVENQIKWNEDEK